MPFQSSISYVVMHAVTRAAAWAISLRRDLVHLRLSDTECEEAGLPDGSFDPKPTITILNRDRTGWPFDCWLDSNTDSPEGCLHIALFGWAGEVFYYRRGHGHDSAQAYVDALFRTRVESEESMFAIV